MWIKLLLLISPQLFLSINMLLIKTRPYHRISRISHTISLNTIHTIHTPRFITPHVSQPIHTLAIPSQTPTVLSRMNSSSHHITITPLNRHIKPHQLSNPHIPSHLILYHPQIIPHT
jgi:hypothetical protein